MPIGLEIGVQTNPSEVTQLKVTVPGLCCARKVTPVGLARLL
jgi:hypothetical protein